MSTNVEQAVDLMVKEAKGRSKPDDYVSRLYAVEMEVLAMINDLMRRQRKEERDAQST